MVAPLIGQRVIVEGLQRADLNGKKGVALSFDDAKNRYNVKLDNSTEPISLKPQNLSKDQSSDAGMGGMPGMGGMGGMPGMGGMGGMPGMGGMGGMPGVGGMGGVLAALLAKLMGGAGGGGGRLPGGMAPQQLMILVPLAFMALRVVGIDFSKMLLLGAVVGGAAYVRRQGLSRSEVISSARQLARRAAGVVSQTTGIPIGESQAAVILIVFASLALRYMFGGSAVMDSPSTPSPSYVAYTKGYTDAKQNRTFDPIPDPPPTAAEPASSGSGWGIGKLMSLAMAGTMVYQLGGGGSGAPWSLNAVLANARNMNPMNLVAASHLNPNSLHATAMRCVRTRCVPGLYLGWWLTPVWHDGRWS